MTLIFIALAVVLFLSYANGSNDNFKGVSTLLGSGVSGFENARLWATLTTGLGSLTALLLAQALMAKFSGKGLVPASVVGMKSFCLAVALAAALTVMLATHLGFPVSTTHALTGGLVGAGWVASSQGVNFSYLGSTFFVPLLSSPLLALTLAAVTYPALRMTRKRLKVVDETCVCIGGKVVGVIPQGVSAAEGLARFQSQFTVPELTVGTTAKCVSRYKGNLWGVSANGILDSAHYLSAGAVGFARGLNDTPKIAALLLVTAALPAPLAISLVAGSMALGGWRNGRRVAEMMSHKVTTLTPSQGLASNLVTAFVVIGASKLGFPVSTTHVSCGSLFGIGLVNRTAQIKTILSILTAWVTTLPVAAALGMVCFKILNRVV